ncbi:MAG: DHH family phosphoesterase [Candidatus Aenigmarchaeota archaeon]|nr:DHH family phosphoesterase [Candidatus Aenigmarchaeota archaeon]
MIDKAARFIQNCDKNTAVIYDKDGDGVGAAAVVAKTLKKLYGKYPKAFPRESGSCLVTESLIDKVIGKFDNIIFVDIAADENSERIVKLTENSKVMVLDHHQVHKDMNQDGVLHVNSSMMESNISSTRYCASKMAFDACSLICDIKELDWLAGLGIVNDKAEKEWSNFMEKMYERNKISSSEFSTINNIINAPFMSSKDDNNHLGYEACLNSTPRQILEGKTKEAETLWELHKTVEDKIASTIKNWEKSAEIDNNKKIILLEIETEFSISSVISTKLSFERPNYTVMVARKNGDYVSASLRRQDGTVNCGKLAKKLTEGIENSSGGGHVPAAGMKMLSKDWNEIKRRIREIL